MKVEICREDNEENVVLRQKNERLEKSMKRYADKVDSEKSIRKTVFNGCKMLFNRLNTKEKQDLLKEGNVFEKIFQQKDLCACCFSVDKTISKCIHFDCPGACAECRITNIDDDCCACGQKQELACPVCLETKPESELEIFKCCLVTGLKCVLKSYRVKKAIKKCPTCRAKI